MAPSNKQRSRARKLARRPRIGAVTRSEIAACSSAWPSWLRWSSCSSRPASSGTGDQAQPAGGDGCNAKIGLRDYQKRVKFDWFQAGQVTDPQGTSLKMLDTMVDDQLLREQAQQRGITVSDDEINETIEKSFGYLPRAADAGALADTRSGRDAEHRANRDAGPQPHAGLTGGVREGEEGLYRPAQHGDGHVRGRLPQDRRAGSAAPEAVR